MMNASGANARAGSVLVLVLVVVALLALGAYTFAEFMTIEQMATTTYGREVQARAAADSGIELAAALVAKRYEPNPASYQNSPQMFEAVLMQSSNMARGRARFSVVSSAEWDTSGRTLRFGLGDESGKLNLNSLANMITAGTIKATDASTMLQAISPDITPEIADSIIDWLDSDDQPLTNGAENEYYQTLQPPYPAKNSLLDSLDELLLVKGMTPAVLFGEDTNHNGLLDPEENDGAASAPYDNADGALQRGLSQYFTIFSREINLRQDGTPKININQSDMQNLYSQVSAEFGTNVATFIVAYRMFGPANSGGSGSGGNSGGGNSGSSGGSGGGSAGNSGGGSTASSGGSSRGGSGGSSRGGSSSSGSSGSSGASGGGNSGSSSRSSGSSGSSAGSSAGGQGASRGSSGQQGGGAARQTGSGAGTMVAGIDVSKGPTYSVKSLYELPGASTQGTVNNAPNTKVPVPTGWTTSTADLSQTLPLIIEKLSLTDAPYIDGRININLAPRELLIGIPNMTESLADQIVSVQMKNSSPSSTTELSPDRLMAGWLVIQQITDINTLEKIDPFITGRGDVFHFQSIGYFEGGGPMARVEAVVDATQDPPQVMFMRDLTELGHGFTATLLSTGTGSTR